MIDGVRVDTVNFHGLFAEAQAVVLLILVARRIYLNHKNYTKGGTSKRTRSIEQKEL